MFFSKKSNEKMSILKEIDTSLYEYIQEVLKKNTMKNIYYLSTIIILFLLNVVVAIASFNHSSYNNSYYKIITIVFFTLCCLCLCLLFVIIREIRKDYERLLSEGFLSYEKFKEMNVIYNIRNEKQALNKNVETRKIVKNIKRL